MRTMLLPRRKKFCQLSYQIHNRFRAITKTSLSSRIRIRIGATTRSAIIRVKLIEVSRTSRVGEINRISKQGTRSVTSAGSSTQDSAIKALMHAITADKKGIFHVLPQKEHTATSTTATAGKASSWFGQHATNFRETSHSTREVRGSNSSTS